MIRRWADLAGAEREPVRNQIKEIFFESSSIREFPSPQAKEDFWSRWTSHYFTHEPERILLLFEGPRLAGYLTGSLSHASNLDRIFSDHLPAYPAEFHINMDQSYRGRGLGKKLLAAFFDDLRSLGVPGVHIITSPESENVRFYRQAGFDFELCRPFKERNLLFMGKSLLA